jgi:hypothetical protein
MKMSDNSIPVYTGHVESGNEVKHEYRGALLVNESLCSLDGFKIEVS